MGAGQCLLRVAVVSVCVREEGAGGCAAVRGSELSTLCPVSLFPPWLGQWELSPSPAAVTCLAPLTLPAACACVLWEGKL